MKFTVKIALPNTANDVSKNPDPQSPLSDSGEFVVELPEAVVAHPPARGESFDVKVSEKGKTTSLKAMFLGDGESVLVGTRIVRLPTNFHAGKRGLYRFRLGEVASPRSLLVRAVRPVEPKKTAASLGGGPLKSPMTGKVLMVNVSEGSAVKEGDVLLTIEAMKMENRIVAECDGMVKALQAKAGSAVTTGEVLLTVEPKGA
jgi:biotin carboxyl carrier protein